jgi:photosystem II stability/assembly factor-like uncharacterized protein
LPVVRADEPPPELPASYLAGLVPRNIGPANMGGRVTAVAVVEKRPTTFYLATATGGLWKTTTAGITWTPLFDNQPTISLGDVAVAPSNPDIVWAGTGEANARNSVSWGDGVYKSVDGGKTWHNMGLRDSQHIGRIVIHPTNPDIVYVAALGHIWGPNKERGLFQSIDGGQTWQHSLALNEDTGCVDLAMDPGDPQTLYCCAYRVRRDGFSGGNPKVMYGRESGIYKTVDGGKTWRRLTRGLPDRPLGRCGISVCRANPRILMAVVQTDHTDVRTVPGQAARPGSDADLGGVFRSTDRGETWVKLNDLCPRPFYFSQIRMDPTNDRRVYVLGLPLFVSDDGGKTFRNDGAVGAHADHHALWISPADPDHLILGGDGGLYLSHDRGQSWEHVRNLPLGQLYAIGLDMRQPYRIYGGLQDNGTWSGPSRTYSREGITPAHWVRVLGADGFHCQPDPNNPDTVYAETQYGGLERINLRTGGAADIRPRALPGQPEYRFNWNAPLLISPHNSRTIYYGGNHLFRSTSRGDSWEVLSPDLTHGQPGPDAARGHTLTAIAESPVRSGLLYAGSDDGMVLVKRGSGAWTDVSARIPGLPPERHISCIECSPFAAGTAYLSIDRHRNDDRNPYLFRTEDFGLSWKPLITGLPAGGPVHVVRADPRNRSLLFAGTEFGLFVSINAGASWQRLRAGLPTVPVHDLAIHPRDRELVIATHGRSIYILDIAPLQELTPAILQKVAHLFELKPALQFFYRGASGFGGGKTYLGANPDYGATVWYALREPLPEAPTLSILDAQGSPVAVLALRNEPGLHRVVWPLRKGAGEDSTAAPPGDYVAVLQAGSLMLRQPVRVETEK